MDNKNIDEILSLIKEKWKQNKDMRFFQLLYILQSQYSFENNNLGKVEEVIDNDFSRVGYDLFNLDDDSFIKFLENKKTKNNDKKN